VQDAVEELFERWRQRGDVAALAGVFDRTAPEIWRVARHLCGNRSEADDLLQATFLAAMESVAPPMTCMCSALTAAAGEFRLRPT
jgi:DNA-directed RNA polymerase specialized sigma24 family protein